MSAGAQSALEDVPLALPGWACPTLGQLWHSKSTTPVPDSVSAPDAEAETDRATGIAPKGQPVHESASAEGVKPNGHIVQTPELDAFSAVENRDDGHMVQADKDAEARTAEKRPAGHGSQRPDVEDE